MPSDSLTLWEIHQGIADTAEALAEATDPGEIERLQDALRAYVREEVGKVSRIRGYIKHGEMMAAAARAEAATQSDRARAWDNRLKALKELVMAVIQEVPGRRKVEGATGWLRVQTNGGKPALEITQPHLVPDEYRTADVRLTREELRLLVMLLDDHMGVAQARETTDCLGQRLAESANASEPNPTKIRLALERGEKIPGARLAEPGEHLRVG